MSVRAMTWAFGQRVGSPMAKLVLLALADHHTDETGAGPFPAIKTIAAETEMNERSVRRHLETLEAAGLIACRAQGRGTVYRLSLPPTLDRESAEPGEIGSNRERVGGGRATRLPDDWQLSQAEFDLALKEGLDDGPDCGRTRPRARNRNFR